MIKFSGNFDNYDSEKLASCYEKLGISEENVSLIHDYLNAFSNLYQILPLREAYKIIASQNKDLITEDCFYELCEIIRHEKNYFYILAEDEIFDELVDVHPRKCKIIHESLLLGDAEEYFELKDMQCGKPLYIPTKQELLKYTDDLYTPVTKEYSELKNFFRKELKKNEEDTENIICECILSINCDKDPLNDIFDKFERIKIRMSKNQVEKFMKLFTDFYNNSPNPFNRGFSPKALAKLYNKPDTSIFNKL